MSEARDEERRVALVTGANRGMAVILGSRDPEKGEAAARRLSGYGLSVLSRPLDVSDDASVGELAARVEEERGRLDVFVNNAGILYDTWQRTLGADLDTVREALETNLFGAWRTCEAFVPLMRRAGYGHVVNVSSGAGSITSMGGETPAYGVSKAALNALTKKLGSELQGTGVLVNAVDPGWTATDMGGHGGRSVEDGAAGVVWAATLPDDGPSGGLFYDGDREPW